jgi:anthranilate/para-aminobenzoate synthase component II
MSDDDLLSSLVSGAPNSADKIKAIVAQLRSKDKLGQLAVMSGDPQLAPLGHQMIQQNQQNEVELGRNAMQNRSDDIRDAAQNRMLNQGQATLNETIRYHNMLDQERKDKLAQAKSLDDFTASSGDTIKAIGEGRIPAPTLSRSPKSIALMEAVTAAYPGFDGTVYQRRQKAEKDFATGPQGNMVRSAPVSLQHLDLADQKADMLNNTNFPAWNAVKNTLGPMLGNQTIAKGVAGMDTAKTIISDEIDKFFINGGGAEKDRQHLQDRLANANGAPALHEVSDTLRQLMAGQMNGLKDQFENNTGGDFINEKVKHPYVLSALGWDGTQFTGKKQAQQPQGSALPGATAAAGQPPGMGSGPPAAPVPGPQGAAPQPSAPTVVRTGMRGNKKVAQMSDGSIVEQP